MDQQHQIKRTLVNSLNQPAITLYKKLGFTHIATRKNVVKESNSKYQDEFFFSMNLET